MTVYFTLTLLYTAGKSPARVMLDIDFKARNTKGKFDASKKVPTDYIPTLEDQLQRAEESLSNIAKEIEFARRQEILLRQTSGILLTPH